MTQTQLANAVGISKQAVSGYENGVRQPSLEIAFEIANVLGVDPRLLFCTSEMYRIVWSRIETVAEGYDVPFGYQEYDLSLEQAKVIYQNLYGNFGTFDLRVYNGYYDCTDEFYHNYTDILFE